MASSKCKYTVVQSDKMVQVRPITVDGKDAASFYDYYSSRSHASIQEQDTSVLYLYSDPTTELVSVGIIHDAREDSDTTGGSVDFNIRVLPVTTNPSPMPIRWIVQDDPVKSDPDFDSLADRNPTWSWLSHVTDGGAFAVRNNHRGLTEGFAMIIIDPDWNLWADLQLDIGIKEWHFLSAPQADPHPDHLVGHEDHFWLNMAEPVVIYSDCPGREYKPPVREPACPRVLEFDLSTGMNQTEYPSSPLPNGAVDSVWRVASTHEHATSGDAVVIQGDSGGVPQSGGPWPNGDSVTARPINVQQSSAASGESPSPIEYVYDFEIPERCTVREANLHVYAGAGGDHALSINGNSPEYQHSGSSTGIEYSDNVALDLLPGTNQIHVRVDHSGRQSGLLVDGSLVVVMN